ncbi:hypothetical protein DWX38_10045 [Bacteroides clarus]|uniref:Uncharacterized protein n=1 Tax=Bacteroides clarus TaxID=626929 RepID=A0A412N2B1_9BACE|nr:hypothetical protein DWX38_10045 [Bacteroides clarus]
MANPLSKRAQRYSHTLTRFYGLRFEKGFILINVWLCYKGTAKVGISYQTIKKSGDFLFLQYLYWAFNIPTYRRYLFLPYICRHNHNLYVRLSEKYISICKYISCNKYQYNAADTRNCMFRYMGLDIQKKHRL